MKLLNLRLSKATQIQLGCLVLLSILVITAISGCSSAGPEEIIVTRLDETPVVSYAEIASTSTASSPEVQEPAASETAVDGTDSDQILTLTHDQPGAEDENTPSSNTDESGSVNATSTAEYVNTETPEPPQETPTPTPVLATPIPFDPTMVLGVPVESIVYLPEAVIRHSREIINVGRALGRDGRAFSKLGDSLIANPHFLTGFDTRPYDLSDYEFLQPAIDHFAGSYERYGVAIHAGLHSWGIFDPMWANKDWCQPNETMVACEFRLNNPSILFILMGSNDAGAPDNFAYNLRKTVEFSIENGVLPVLATKADRFEGPENTNNIILKEIAAEYAIPLWDFDLVAAEIPDRGLKEDLVHLTPFDEFDYTLPEALRRGHGVHNLTALMVLEAIRTQVMQQP
jgi:hypothetical protein